MAVVLKGYPRLSETFIAQELLGLERAGFELSLISLRHPTDKTTHPVHSEIAAPVNYLPEYLYQEPLRVLSGLVRVVWRAGFWRALGHFARDLPRDLTPNRGRRFGQAIVLAAEFPADTGWIHAHFIHTPASVASYAATMLGLPWTCSAHAKDIWTAPDWDIAEKLAAMQWAVTCTHPGYERLAALAGGRTPVHLSHHGLDLSRFGPFDREPSDNCGAKLTEPLRILTVGRAVEKKGFDVLLRALALLPEDLVWRLVHVGGGDVSHLKALASDLGIADRVSWAGALTQPEVLTLYRTSDLFVLACRVADDGDRDGLPNVLVEAASQQLACVSTNISGVPELIEDGVTGLLVPPEDPPQLARAVEALIRDPALRQRLGSAADARVRSGFDYMTSIRYLTDLFRGSRRGSE